MIKKSSVTEHVSTINYQFNNSNGGFITYLKLYIKIWLMLKNNSYLMSKWQICYSIIEFLFKTPYWILIKPLGWFYSTKITYQAQISSRISEGRIIKFKISNYKKTIVPYLLKIPFFYYTTSKVSSKDETFLKDHFFKKLE